MVHGNLRKLNGLLLCTVAVVFVSLTTAAAQAIPPNGLSSNGTPLLGTRWNLVTLFKRSVPLDGRESHFVLRERERIANGSTGSLVGEVGVNGLTANYQTSGNSLRVSIVAVGAVGEYCHSAEECGQPGDLDNSLVLEKCRSTEGCRQSAQTGRSLLDALRTTAYFQINSSILELRNQQGEILARLAAAEPDPH
jgi:heat shock protein HslJ